MTTKGTITKIAGPVVHADINGAMNDIVRVGDESLLGEIIEIQRDTKIIQVYEDTNGLNPGKPVKNTEEPLSVTLGPGLLGNVYDGTQRPLDNIYDDHGTFIPRGIQKPSINQDKEWAFKPTVEEGDTVEQGDIIGTVEENNSITHKVLVPPGHEGTITTINDGKHTVTETIAEVNGEPITLQQEWPVRRPRPTTRTKEPTEPLITGQRILDFLFPLPKGGVAAIPGPFGAGKTVTQQQLAKWCDADIIVYIGCGERGNEMTEVLEDFPELEDPKTGEPLMNRTVLVANTSNMPVAAREACVYTGMTIAEYYRDQGYDVALMADSTSRWAEAMREISGRLEEMPGEEGFPAYLSKRLAEFYERAGAVTTMNGDDASITAVGAVSPPGGDFSEPVTQNTLRIVKAFYALDSDLADKRHFPSINWHDSYSLYHENVSEAFIEQTKNEWPELRNETTSLLQREKELLDIVQLVGREGLSDDDKIDLDVARIIREDFLQQDAFHPIDTYCPPQKQYHIIKTIHELRRELHSNIDSVDLTGLRDTDIVHYIRQLKYDDNDEFNDLNEHEDHAETLIDEAMEEL